MFGKMVAFSWTAPYMDGKYYPEEAFRARCSTCSHRKHLMGYFFWVTPSGAHLDLTSKMEFLAQAQLDDRAAINLRLLLSTKNSQLCIKAWTFYPCLPEWAVFDIGKIPVDPVICCQTHLPGYRCSRWHLSTFEALTLQILSRADLFPKIVEVKPQQTLRQWYLFVVVQN